MARKIVRGTLMSDNFDGLGIPEFHLEGKIKAYEDEGWKCVGAVQHITGRVYIQTMEKED